jgi:hypothetical protein
MFTAQAGLHTVPRSEVVAEFLVMNLRLKEFFFNLTEGRSEKPSPMPWAAVRLTEASLMSLFLYGHHLEVTCHPGVGTEQDSRGSIVLNPCEPVC